MSEDPIGFDGGLNLYGYVGNNPMTYTDPSGQAFFLPVLVGAGVSLVAGFTLSTVFGQCYGWKDILTDWAIDAATFGTFKGVKWLAKAMGRAPKARHLMKSMRPQLMKGIERGGGRFGQKAWRGADNVGNRLRQTGAGSDFRSADDLYESIRRSSDDVREIAENTGIKPQNIQKVKQHVFEQEHLLDRYVDQGVSPELSRFDSSFEIAQAWERLRTGVYTPQDLQFLRHEAAESWHMRRHGPSYNNAHNTAQRRYPSPF